MIATTYDGNVTGAEMRLPDHRPRRRKRVLVTGGAGFLGSHLCERVVGEGHDVTAIDNFLTGSADNVRHLERSGRFTLVEHDVVDPLPEALPRFDEIYNLACPASPVHYQADPVRTLATCSIGTLNVLDRASRDGARILHASTSEIYGDPEVHPQQEGYWGNVNTIGPRSCYDEGKRFAETLMTDYARRDGLTLRIARIFNTYGPRMQPDDGRVVSNFIIQALGHDDITIYGDGSQTRSFCFVSDLIEGFVRLMRAEVQIDGPINLGNPKEVTVAALAKRVIALTGSPSTVTYRPLPVDDPRRRRPDITRARRLLGWSPLVGSDEGLRATIDYFSRRADSALPARVRAAPSMLSL